MKLYRLSQIKDIEYWNEDKAHSMIICAANESDARKLAIECEKDRGCEQLWGAESAKITEISMIKSKVIQVV